MSSHGLIFKEEAQYNFKKYKHTMILDIRTITIEFLYAQIHLYNVKFVQITVHFEVLCIYYMVQDSVVGIYINI